MPRRVEASDHASDQVLKAGARAVLRLHRPEQPGAGRPGRCGRDHTAWPCDVEVLRWWMEAAGALPEQAKP